MLKTGSPAFTTSAYAEQLETKTAMLKQLFGSRADVEQLEVHASEIIHYRARAEFRIWHQQDRSYYAMYERGQYREVVDFPAACRPIHRLMPLLLEQINSNGELRRKLFQVNFLTAPGTERCVVTMIYHRELDRQWLDCAHKLTDQLSVDIVGRSRGQRLLSGRDFIEGSLDVDGRNLRWQFHENCFSQPNPSVNRQMIAWALATAEQLPSTQGLLELHAGAGNFTIPLAAVFRRILSTEPGKSSLTALNANLKLNDIDNVTARRIGDGDIGKAWHNQRQFRRLQGITLSQQAFPVLFCDPPRCGLSAEARALLPCFRYIIYFSCNPHTLIEDIARFPQLQIGRLAFFDQFPYTDHCECAVLLENPRPQPQSDR